MAVSPTVARRLKDTTLTYDAFLCLTPFRLTPFRVSPGQSRLCGRRPGLGMPTTLQAEGLLHRLPSRLATNDADFQPAIL
jgi:hypothetical protein